MTDAIEERYSELASGDCCLSCGTAAMRCEPTLGQVCVDLGSGRGTDVLRLAGAVGPTGHAYGIDVTDAMLERARKTAEKLGVDNATFLHSELEKLDLPDEIADWVTSNCVLNHASDKASVWREIARVLKPGGQFVVSDIYAVGEIAEEYSNDPALVAECWAGAVPKTEYFEHIAGAGLVDVEVVEESEPYEKGKASVVSFTVSGRRPRRIRCCG
jgi:ubiquinone/menaquinone biosynthesis C-methylase UbiE